MRFLVDASLSPRLAEALRAAGHNAVHVGEVTSLCASDIELFQLAADRDRIIVSADTDFGELLARRGSSKPSVVLFRRQTRRRARERAMLLLTHLVDIEADVRQGAIVVIEEARIRVRRLPIGGPDGS